MKLRLDSTNLDTSIVTRRDFIKYTAVSAAALAMGLGTVSGVRAQQTLPESYVIDVPFYYQETDNWCGEASTEMVLAYLNPQAVPSQSELAQEFDPDDPSRGNSTVNRIVSGFQSRGYTEVAFHSKLSIDQLKQLISNGILIICEGGFDGFHKADGECVHFIVAVGYDDEHQQMIVNDPTPDPRYGGSQVTRDYGLFDEQWTSGSWVGYPVGSGERWGVVVPYKGTTYIPPP